MLLTFLSNMVRISFLDEDYEFRKTKPCIMYEIEGGFSPSIKRVLWKKNKFYIGFEAYNQNMLLALGTETWELSNHERITYYEQQKFDVVRSEILEGIDPQTLEIVCVIHKKLPNHTNRAEDDQNDGEGKHDVVWVLNSDLEPLKRITLDSHLIRGMSQVTDSARASGNDEFILIQNNQVNVMALSDMVLRKLSSDLAQIAPQLKILGNQLVTFCDRLSCLQGAWRPNQLWVSNLNQ